MPYVEQTSAESADLLRVYVDESGNSGDAAAGSATDFGGQRAFCLVGIGDDAGRGSIDQILKELRRKYNVLATEIKNRVIARRPTLIVDLVRELSARNSIFIEIMDKKFY